MMTRKILERHHARLAMRCEMAWRGMIEQAGIADWTPTWTTDSIALSDCGLLRFAFRLESPPPALTEMLWVHVVDAPQEEFLTRDDDNILGQFITGATNFLWEVAAFNPPPGPGPAACG